MAAPTLIYQPPRLMGVRDQHWAVLGSDGFVQTAPATSARKITFLSQPDPGQKITFTLPDGTTTFLEAVSGTPDDSGTQYQIGGSTAATLANFIAAANANWRLRYWYAVTDDTGALFTAHAPGASALIAVWDAPVWGGTATVSAGGAGAWAPHYAVGITLWVEEVWDSGTYTRVKDIELRPGADGRVRENLSPWLLPYTGYDWPAFGADEPLRATSLQRRWHWDRWEAYGDPLAPRYVTNSRDGLDTTPHKAWYAGTRNHERDEWTVFQNWLKNSTTLPANATPFLTLRGDGGRHEVTEDQQHYLAWYQRLASATITMRCTVTYSDGSTDSDDIAVGTDVLQGEIGIYPTGFKVLDLHLLQPTKEPVTYTVQLLQGEVAVSLEHLFYIVDPDHNELFIEFVNSLGGIESLRCVGAWEVTAEAAYTDVQRALAPSSGTPPASHESAGSSLLEGVQPVLMVYSDWLDDAERDALLDIVFSPEWRLLDLEGERKLPLRLQNHKQQAGQRGTETEHLHRLEFSFVHNDPHMAWTRIGTVPELEVEGDPEL